MGTKNCQKMKEIKNLNFSNRPICLVLYRGANNTNFKIHTNKKHPVSIPYIISLFETIISKVWPLSLVFLIRSIFSVISHGVDYSIDIENSFCY